ncbi:RNA polymerase III subunit C82 [Ophidiomyces ophidiicola]|nr:RNA polymerase III subunit C82 [Ophidiomyces ophidiicola]
MSQYAAELCNLLITDNFGELYSLIFSYLLQYGRQPLPKIVQNTHLSPRQVRHGLAVLIQQRLIFHCTSVADGITYYESDWRTAYNLVRSGKAISLVQERLGAHAAKVISTLLALGHAKVSYLETLPELRPVVKTYSLANGINGTLESKQGDLISEDGTLKDDMNTKEFYQSNGPVKAPNDYHQFEDEPQVQTILQQLAAFGYICRVRNQNFQSPEDNFEAALKVARSSGDSHGLKGNKLEAKLTEDAEKLVKEWTDSTISRVLPSASMLRGVKRRLGNDDISAPRKKIKLDEAVDEDEYKGGNEDENDEEGDFSDDDMASLDPNMIIRVNYEKFDVAFRNKRLVDLASQSITSVTSHIYETLLSHIELRTPQCRERIEAIPEGEEAEQYSIPVHLHTISKDLDSDLDLAGTIAGIVPDAANGTGDADEDPGGDYGSAGLKPRGPSRNYLVDQHLSLLAAEPNFFCTRRMQSGMITWAVEYRHLARKLRHLELERIIEARFGSAAVRIVRVLSSKGKLDEKRLQEISLMASKDLRQLLGQMAGAGFVELQEVPRDAQRQPSRTIYLWFYDTDRARMMVVEDSYKAMSRCLQRIRFERQKLKYFLEKTERTDVKGNEERYLSPNELQKLKTWKATEAMLLGEVARLDDLVSVLRDY